MISSRLFCLFLFLLPVFSVKQQRKSSSSNEHWLSQSPDMWDADWKSGSWDYMDKVAVERSKMAVLGGVLVQMYAKPDARVLDVGCGEGPLSDFLIDKQKENYVGMDISKVAIAAAKRLRGAPRKFVQAISHEFKPNNKFDVIIFSDMLYYVEHEKVLKQYKEFLNPDGLIMISSDTRTTRHTSSNIQFCS